MELTEGKKEGRKEGRKERRKEVSVAVDDLEEDDVVWLRARREEGEWDFEEGGKEKGGLVGK